MPGLSCNTTSFLMPAASTVSKNFIATLERGGDRLNWVIIRVPLFYYRNPESRARRLEKAIAMMMEYAEQRETRGAAASRRK